MMYPTSAVGPDMSSYSGVSCETVLVCVVFRLFTIGPLLSKVDLCKTNCVCFYSIWPPCKCPPTPRRATDPLVCVHV